MMRTSTTGELSIEAGPESSSQPRPQPPPLPRGAGLMPADRAAAQAAFAERMLERLAASDYAGALTAAETLLLHQPCHEDALDCAQISRSELRKLYVARLGSLQRVPRVTMGVEGVIALALDVRAGLVLSRVDGHGAIDRIVEESGLPPLDALRILSELYLHQVIALDE